MSDAMESAKLQTKAFDEDEMSTVLKDISAMADISNIESLKDKVSPEEWEVRVQLAAVYRLIALEGWDDMIYTHISARVPGPEHHFLINPWGMLFDEITASSLIKIDAEGNKLTDTPFMVNPAGFTIHSAMHMNCKDANCVIHLHTDDGVAVSAQQEGLLPISQHAMICSGRIAYHDYEGIALELDERERLVADMGDNKLMILRNHGTLAIGRDCPTAFQAMFYLERACSMQIRAQSGGTLNIPKDGTAEISSEQGEGIFNGMAGALAWPALIRKLNRLDPSFQH